MVLVFVGCGLGDGYGGKRIINFPIHFVRLKKIIFLVLGFPNI